MCSDYLFGRFKLNRKSKNLTEKKPSIIQIKVFFFRIVWVFPANSELTNKVPYQLNTIYNSFESVLHAYDINKIDLHEMVWLRWSSYIQTQNPFPLQLNISPNGHVTSIYDSFVIESGSDHQDCLVKSPEITQTTKKIQNSKFENFKSFL